MTTGFLQFGCPGGCRGLTVVELLVTLLVASVVLTVGAPAMGSFIKQNRLQSASLGLMSTMQFARSEAAKRKTQVVLCRTADPTAATPTCGGTTRTWTTGWLVFASGDSNNTYQSATDTMLRTGGPMSSGITVMTNSTTNNNLEYNSDGTTNEGGGTGRFAICDGRGDGFGRQVNVPPVGRPTIEVATGSDPVDCDNPS